MKSTVLLVFVLLGGCQSETDSDGKPKTTTDSPTSAAPPVTTTLTNRVWTRSDSTGLPGVIRIFLTDGTLVLDSCWETHRLSKWQLQSDGSLLWQEDGMNIKAEVLTLSERELVLRLHLVSGTEDEHYAPASVPYVCPDMPR